MSRKELAMNYFKEGYNCAQSIALAFSDVMGMEPATAAQLTSGFGGGVARLREVCGAVSGMTFVINAIYGYSTPEKGPAKIEFYEKIQGLAKEFEERNGSIVCRELLGLDVKHDTPEASPRTEEFYKKRPCVELVGDAAEILENYLGTSNE